MIASVKFAPGEISFADMPWRCSVASLRLDWGSLRTPKSLRQNPAHWLITLGENTLSFVESRRIQQV
jgi:hypothetical protein